MRLHPYAFWPETEKACYQWLSVQLPGNTVTTQTGTDLADVAADGVVVVARVPGGGADAEQVQEGTQIDVYCFTAASGGRARLWDLARRAHTAMLRLDTSRTPAGQIDTVDTEASPGEIPYGNPDLLRTVASYRLVTRVSLTS